MNFENITFETVDNATFIGFGQSEKKSMTTLSEPTLKELDAAIDEVKKLAKEKSTKGLILFSHKDNCFLAGVDINMISSLSTEEAAAEGAKAGQEIYNKIEDLPITTIACVNGVCMGGGLELALSCNFILASDNPKTALALPEVKLGVLPGFGGTYRLPKRVGLPSALDMILSGKNIKAKKAKRMGLADEVYPKEKLVDMAKQWLKKPKVKKASLADSVENLATDNFLSKKIIFQKARENVLSKTKGFYQAPLKILDLMEGGSFKNRSSYLKSEASAFGELCVGEQSQNLQHVFFLMDGSKKKRPASGNKIERGAVLGAGTMGGGIAWLFAQNGENPYMKDINVEGLKLGLKQSSRNFSGALKRKRITRDDFERLQRSIIPTLSFDGFQKVDLLIEAVVENMDVKKKVFSEAEKYVSADCLLTSNTSSLSVNEMAEALEKPERFAGLHFFNPVNKMPLVEIIRHDKVSEETINDLYNWVLKSKKTPVVVGDGPGFLVNRILMPFINESAFLLEEGVSVEALDSAVLNFGMPMGPCRLMDEVGIDVLVHVGKIMHDGLGDRAMPNHISSKIVDAGCLGVKSSKGFYLYDGKGKQGELNAEVEKLLPKRKVKMSEKEIQKRVIIPMINEAANILDEKIVEKASDVDLGLIFGIGFPPFRGGLLRYADKEGLDKIFETLLKFEKNIDKDRYCPSPYFKKLVENKTKFYDH